MQTDLTIFLVDDEPEILELLRDYFEGMPYGVKSFTSAQDFLDNLRGDSLGCLLLDVRMPEIGGLELQEILFERGCHLPIIFITGYGDVATAVQAVQRGAFNFVQKPFKMAEINEIVQKAMAYVDRHKTSLRALNNLTPKEKTVYEQIVLGHANKAISANLDISLRTVEFHRKNILKKFGTNDTSALVAISRHLIRTN